MPAGRQVIAPEPDALSREEYLRETPMEGVTPEFAAWVRRVTKVTIRPSGAHGTIQS